MKQLTILSGKATIVELPEGAINPHIHPNSNGLWYKYERDKGGFSYKRCDLPPGNWRIIGMLSEVREEQLDGIVECDGATYAGFGEEVFSYPNHCGGSSFETRLESLESAILAEGYAWNNPYGTNTLYYTDKFTGKKKVRVDWAELQSRVLDRSRCLLLGRDDEN